MQLEPIWYMRMYRQTDIQTRYVASSRFPHFFKNPQIFKEY